jgi:hypothetical protein
VHTIAKESHKLDSVFCIFQNVQVIFVSLKSNCTVMTNVHSECKTEVVTWVITKPNAYYDFFNSMQHPKGFSYQYYKGSD